MHSLVVCPAPSPPRGTGRIWLCDKVHYPCDPVVLAAGRPAWDRGRDPGRLSYLAFASQYW